MATKFLSGIDVNSQRVQAVADPTNASDGANKSYVDNLVQGLTWKEPVVAASTSNVSISSAPATLDGVNLTADDRILLKNQTAGAENGIYKFSSSGAALTRTTDADSATEIRSATVMVAKGDTNADKTFSLQTDDVTLGTTALTFVEINSGTTYTAGDALSETPAGTFNVVPGTGLEISADTIRVAASLAGDGLTGGGGTNMAVGQGTGIIVNADDVAVDTSTVVRKFAVDVGDGSSTSITVTHNLGTQDVTVQLYDKTSPYQQVFTDVKHTSTTTITLEFASAPASAAYRCVVHG